MVILGCTDKRAPAGLRAHRHRTLPYVDSLGQHSSNQHLCEPSSQYGTCALRLRRLGTIATVALLGCSDRWWSPCWGCLPIACGQSTRRESTSLRPYPAEDLTERGDLTAICTSGAKRLVIGRSDRIHRGKRSAKAFFWFSVQRPGRHRARS